MLIFSTRYSPYHITHKKNKVVRGFHTNAFTKASPWTLWGAYSSPRPPAAINWCGHIFSVLSPDIYKNLNNVQYIQTIGTITTVSQICTELLASIIVLTFQSQSELWPGLYFLVKVENKAIILLISRFEVSE